LSLGLNPTIAFDLAPPPAEFETAISVLRVSVELFSFSFS
jgi:hypothetical protein